MKSSVTEFSSVIGTNGPTSGPTCTPSTSAMNAADARLSRAPTMVWLSSIIAALSPATERRSACRGCFDDVRDHLAGHRAGAEPRFQRLRHGFRSRLEVAACFDVGAYR